MGGLFFLYCVVEKDDQEILDYLEENFSNWWKWRSIPKTNLTEKQHRSIRSMVYFYNKLSIVNEAYQLRQKVCQFPHNLDKVRTLLVRSGRIEDPMKIG